jgi:hypothetical protein
MKTYCRGLVKRYYVSALGMDPSENFRSLEDRERSVVTRIKGLIGEDSTTFHSGPDDALVDVTKFLPSHY